MFYEGHLGGGLIAGTFLSVYTADVIGTFPALTLGVVLVGCGVLPDIDGYLQRLLAAEHEELVIHRGRTHTVPFAVLMGFLCAWGAAPWGAEIAVVAWVAGYIGVFTHLLLDTINPLGVPWAYPAKDRTVTYSVPERLQVHASAEWLNVLLLIAGAWVFGTAAFLT